MENQDLQKDELEKIEGIGIYLESSRDWIINSIYDFIQEKPKESLIVVYLCEVEDVKLALYCKALEMLKNDNIIKDYKIKPDCVTIPEKKKQYTKADLMFDFDKFIENNQWPDPFDDPIVEQHPVSLITNKKDVDFTAIKNLVTSKKIIKELELLNIQGAITIYVNNDYINCVKTRVSSNENSFWKKLYSLAGGEKIGSDENVIKYFNINKHNPLYSKTPYKPTKILTSNRGFLEKNVPIGIITQEKINRITSHKK